LSSNVCIISIIVDARGFPENPLVTRSLRMGPDDKAIEAVYKHRFKSAVKDGRPVVSFVRRGELLDLLSNFPVIDRLKGTMEIGNREHGFLPPLEALNLTSSASLPDFQNPTATKTFWELPPRITR
jgi:hypothetical protein